MASTPTLNHTDHCAELPNEILLLILQNCPRSTLKNVRLATKTLEQLATPVLWSKVVLIPNLNCIHGFVEALEGSPVLVHITKLVYDARFAKFFERVKAEIPHVPFVDTTSREHSLDVATQGRFQPQEDMGVEVSMLAKALRLLPNLRALRVREIEGLRHPGPSSPLATFKIPYYYQKMCQKYRVILDASKYSSMSGTPGRSYTKGILTAAYSSNTRLHSLKTMNIDGRGMFGLVAPRPTGANPQLRLLRDVLQDLQELELGFQKDSLVSMANNIEAISFLLKAARKLKRLRLRMSDCTLTRCQFVADEFPSDLATLLETPAAGWIHRPLVPRLETLTLDGCVCHDQDLLHLLKLHSATLRHLKLSHIALLGVGARRKCWVNLIKRFKTDLKLTSISFSGSFNNGGRQQWFVATDSVDPNRLKARVERYVVDKRVRECPLERVAIKPDQADVDKPVNGEEWEGDLTWTMVYNSRFSNQVVWELAQPSFGISSSMNTSNPSSVAAEDDSLATDSAADDDYSWSDGWYVPHDNNTVVLCTKKKPPKGPGLVISEPDIFKTMVDLVTFKSPSQSSYSSSQTTTSSWYSSGA